MILLHVFGSFAFLLAITLLFFAYTLAALVIAISLCRYCKQIWEDISRFTYDKATFALHYSFFLPSRKQLFILTTCVLLATGTLYIKNWSAGTPQVLRTLLRASMPLQGWSLRISAYWATVCSSRKGKYGLHWNGCSR